jgi:hypothetical protein
MRDRYSFSPGKNNPNIDTIRIYQEIIAARGPMIVKARHTSDFFQMNNEAIQDASLSWAAKGLLAYLLSLPEELEVRLRHIITRSSCSRFATESALNELINERNEKKEQGGNKRRDTKYTVYENPALCRKPAQ